MNNTIFKCNFCDETMSYLCSFYCDKCVISYSKNCYSFRMNSDFKISETMESSKYIVYVYPQSINIDAIIDKFTLPTDYLLQIDFDLLPTQKFKSLDEISNLAKALILKHKKLYAYQ